MLFVFSFVILECNVVIEVVMMFCVFVGLVVWYGLGEGM